MRSPAARPGKSPSRGWRGLATVAAVALLGAQPSCGEHGDPLPFAGRWFFLSGKAFAVCGPHYSVRLDGVSFNMGLDNHGGLTFEVGCDCALSLQVDPDGQQAHSVQPVECLIVAGGSEIRARVESVTVTRDEDGDVSVAVSGDQASVTSIDSCADLAVAGPAERDRLEPTSCGANETAVGVIPVGTGDLADCLPGAGRSGLRITTSDETMDPDDCSTASGAAGEGTWLPPDAVKPSPPLACFANGASTDPAMDMDHHTQLSFCRVDGSLFRPLTTDPTAVEQFYAVLKLGDTCPNGSIDVEKTIDNENDPSGYVKWLGNIAPNQVNPPGTNTTLHFCLFRAAASAAEVMDGFPSFAIQYAVFHDFDGAQPWWVLFKRWKYSNDEDDQGNSYVATPPDPTAIRDLLPIVENPDNNTFYDLARVQ